jgi:monofunctional chorismate mutase
MSMVCRGVRGATTCASNTRDAILAATSELMRAVIDANSIDKADVASVWFTTTADINAEFPAVAARQLGWTDTALMCTHDSPRQSTRLYPAHHALEHAQITGRDCTRVSARCRGTPP